MSTLNTIQDHPAPAGSPPARTRAALWTALTLSLLGGLCADRAMFHTPSADVKPYHARVREVAAESAPLRVGPWSGAETPLPPAAVTLLNPNVALSRRYRNAVTGRQVSFLLVHCSDARDVLGHYPPVCYVGAGWTLASAEPRDWVADGLPVHGMAYRFASDRLDHPEAATVANFMVLPDGTTCRDMDGVTRNAGDPRKKFFGAAQVQVVWDGTVSESECDETVATFVRANRRLLDTILSGVPHE